MNAAPEGPAAIQKVPDVTWRLDASVSERAAVESSFDALAPIFEGAGGPRSGLWLVSPDAGGQTAVKFWADACRTGVALANPDLFPWCLANAACGALARRFKISGPNATLLGEDDALLAAAEAAVSALARGQIDIAWVVSVTMSDAASRPAALRAWRLDAHDGGAV